MKVQGRIRRVYSPLDMNVGYTVGGTGLKQVFKTVALEYEPDRSLFNTVVTPNVTINDKDGVYPSGNANRALSLMTWYANGVELVAADYDVNSGEYLLDTSDTASRGALTIKKNVASTSPIRLTFKANIADTRNGTTLRVTLENILLTTEDVSADQYTLEIDKPVDNTYNPIGLAEFNYVVNPVVFLGADKLVDLTGLTFALFYMNGTNKVACTTTSAPEVLSLTAGVATFDLRLISRRTYFLQLLKDGNEEAFVQFEIARKYPPYALDMTTYGDLRKGQSVIPAKAIIHAGSTLLADAGKYFSIVWHTVSLIKGDIAHNMGAVAEIPADLSGVDQGAIDIYYDLNEKPAHQVATDSLGNVFTNAANEPYIFN